MSSLLDERAKRKVARDDRRARESNTPSSSAGDTLPPPRRRSKGRDAVRYGMPLTFGHPGPDVSECDDDDESGNTTAGPDSVNLHTASPVWMAIAGSDDGNQANCVLACLIGQVILTQHHSSGRQVRDRLRQAGQRQTQAGRSETDNITPSDPSNVIMTSITPPITLAKVLPLRDRFL